MAYLVFSSHKGEEIGRRRLEGAVTIGRAPDCDVSLHDHLLSRHHCKLEKTEDGWAVTDLGSRNGTIVHGESVKRHVLRDGESFTIGRVKVRFRSGSLAKGQEATVVSGRPKRPADPFDALSGTVAGYRYEPPAEEKHIRDVDRFPSPKPVMTDSGRFVAVTDSGRFVGVTDDVWLTDLPDETDQSGSAPHGLVAEGSRVDKADGEGETRHAARPKAPEGVDPERVAKAQPPGPPPLPPSAPLRLRLTPFFRKLGSKLRHPLGRWAAVLLALAGIGALVVAVM